MIAICSAFRRPSGSTAFRSHSDAAGEGERAPEQGLGIQQEVSTSELCAKRHRAIIGEGGETSGLGCVYGEGGKGEGILK